MDLFHSWSVFFHTERSLPASPIKALITNSKSSDGHKVNSVSTWERRHHSRYRPGSVEDNLQDPLMLRISQQFRILRAHVVVNKDTALYFS